MSWSRLSAVAPIVFDAAAARGREAPAAAAALAGAVTPPLPTAAAAPAVQPAIVELPPGVAVGDVLSFEVVETGARLRLAARGAMSGATPPGWQLDPLALSQVRGAAPDDAAALAVAWRAGIAQRLRAAAGETALTMPQTPPPPWAASWLGLPLALAIPLPEDGEDAAPPPPGLRRAPALHLVVDLPRLGRVSAHLQLGVGGLWLGLACVRRETLPALKRVLPALAAGLRDAGIVLLRCRVQVGGLAAGAGAVPLGVLPVGSLLPPSLFAAATEVVLALVQADAGAVASEGVQRLSRGFR
ncbi:hypothetical protein IWX58_003516 [Rubrivivax gelatinosus]|uniref:hypothetical protein n=1 Tax=Rubrivivax gelatinosus TaxID=28068 RepID=UPI0018CBBB88|nr:hypothetical protein [Rubrivivax gelatinosus]MBG6081829.1 hypothetical protein [Rubrivivax gelatinosus]